MKKETGGERKGRGERGRERHAIIEVVQMVGVGGERDDRDGDGDVATTIAWLDSHGLTIYLHTVAPNPNPPSSQHSWLWATQERTGPLSRGNKRIHVCFCMPIDELPPLYVSPIPLHLVVYNPPVSLVCST